MKRMTTRPWMFVWTPVLAAGLLAAVAVRKSPRGARTPAAKSPADAAAIDQAKAVSRAFRSAADAVSKSVVKIRSHTRAHTMSNTNSSGQLENPFKGTPFEQMFPNMPEFNGQSNGQIPQRDGVGSGVIIDKSGIVLTNNHVVTRSR